MGLLGNFKLWRKLKREELLLRSVAIGMNSTIDWKTDLHIVMFDYDIKEFERVEESVTEAQAFWGLSDAFVYRTKNGFHCFFWFDHVPYGRLLQIIQFAKYVDPMYKYISRYYDHKTIRVAGKYKERDISFLGVLFGRKPSKEELEIGMLKYGEHCVLSGLSQQYEAIKGELCLLKKNKNGKA
jgi:hypothetical protein